MPRNMRGIGSMGAAMISRIRISDADTPDDEVCKQHLSPLLDGRRMPFHFLHLLPGAARLLTIRLSQEADGVDHIPAIHAPLEVPRHTPPQIDRSAYRNRQTVTRAVDKGEERTHTFLALLRPLTTFFSTPAQLVFENDPRNDGDKSKSGKKKPDKNKSKPDKQSGREQQDQQKPKTKG
jgi:hypothetical protein